MIFRYCFNNFSSMIMSIFVFMLNVIFHILNFNFLVCKFYVLSIWTASILFISSFFPFRESCIVIAFSPLIKFSFTLFSYLFNDYHRIYNTYLWGLLSSEKMNTFFFLSPNNRDYKTIYYPYTSLLPFVLLFVHFNSVYVWNTTRK